MVFQSMRLNNINNKIKKYTPRDYFNKKTFLSPPPFEI